MIHAVGLTKKFDDFLAVKEINLDVPKGQVLILLGPNGAGKTTTIRMLSSVLRPTSGTATIAGYDVVTHAKSVRSSVGVLTEQHGLYKRMNAYEYLNFFAQVYQIESSEASSRITTLLQQFGLGDVGKKRLGEYSKGMRQKLALIRALLHDPPILLLDEPTSAMDPESAKTVRDSIRGLRSGDRTIILCTHNLAEAEELADQIAIIQNGRIIMCDTSIRLKEKLLGPEEYEIQLASKMDGRQIPLPDGISISLTHEMGLRYRVSQPEVENPRLLRYWLEAGLDIVALQKVPQSLETAYLNAIQQEKTSDHA